MGRFRIGRCSSDPISFAVESAKLSGLAEPGKDWSPHAPNFRARRAQSVIRYRLNSPSIFSSPSFSLSASSFSTLFSPTSFASPRFFPIFLLSFSLSLSLSLSCHSFFFRSPFFFPAFFRFFSLVRQRGWTTPSRLCRARRRTSNAERISFRLVATAVSLPRNRIDPTWIYPLTRVN